MVILASLSGIYNSPNENRKHKHLTVDDRCIIQEELLGEKTFKEIGQRLGKDPSTVSKEVQRNLTRVQPKNFGKLIKHMHETPNLFCTRPVQQVSELPGRSLPILRYCTLQ
ncbi:MAG: helix-turn-helix domain-containing protein [Bacillota bacterium]|jgi:hypothetical protein